MTKLLILLSTNSVPQCPCLSSSSLVVIYCKSVLVLPGQSLITFIYDFVERFEGPHPGYAVLSGRPQAGTLIIVG